MLSDFLRAPLLILPLALLLGCPPEEVNEDPTPTPEFEYAEQEDDDNGSPFEPEEVDIDWDPTANPVLNLNGDMSSCDYDASEGGPWTGDEDNFALTMPADGILYMETNWTDGDGDLDWLWWSEVPDSGPMGGNASPDHQISGQGSEMHWDFDDARFEAGDVMVFTFVCASGSGEYSMRLEWED